MPQLPQAAGAVSEEYRLAPEKDLGKGSGNFLVEISYPYRDYKYRLPVKVPSGTAGTDPTAVGYETCL
jgi:hypothetical protein